MQYFDFGKEYQISRVFKGNWQLAGGHGAVDIHQAIEDLFKFVEHGVNVFDVGDIYTGAEEILGTFLKRYRAIHGAQKCQKLRVHTKFVPDLDALATLSKKDIRYVIERSANRLGLESLHLVQFHWWDFSVGNYLEAASYLFDLQREGLIEDIGVTNFDVEHLEKMFENGFDVASNQIQFSLLDPRPLNGMLDFATSKKMHVFCYGVLAGGLLGNGNPVFDPTNRSHIKYQLMIDEIGHDYYDSVLESLAKLATKYNASVANIATQYVLKTDGVSSVILGPRNASHIQEVDQLFDFELSDKDYSTLHNLMSTKLKDITSDIYSYERERDGAHGRIMKYNLNNMRPKE